MITVNGEERGLALTVRALSDVTALCPDQSIDRFDEIFADGVEVETLARLVSIMSECYERRAANADHRTMRDPVTADDVLDMDLGELATVGHELQVAVTSAMRTTVKAESTKKAAAAAA